MLARHGLEFVKLEQARGCYLVSMPKHWYVPDVVKRVEAEREVVEAIPNYYVFYGR